MPTVLERLRAALRPDYEVERELASGGMGTVFLAHDVSLARPVAIKIIRPEHSTAFATERFVREAQILANLTHPNVVPVHKGGEAEGFWYFVMDFVSGQTLKERLDKGPLSHEDALKLGLDLLAALEVVHRQDVVHRDIKPSNIFLVGDRALLGDFGIAKSEESTTSGDIIKGTPGYMPPEQALGVGVSPQTDLYAMAMVLYEAYTGRRWEPMLPIGNQDRDWSGIPRSVAAVLRRALAWEPKDRWQDAAQFRKALVGTKTRRQRQHTGVLIVVGIATGAAIGSFLLREETLPPADVAVLPFEVENPADSVLGTALAQLVDLNIGVLDLPPRHQTSRIYESVRGGSHLANADMLTRFAADAYTLGHVERRQDSVSVGLSLITSGDTVTHTLRGTVSDQQDLSCRIAFWIVEVVDSKKLAEHRCNPGLVGRTVEAVAEFQAGEHAARQNRWHTARERYRAAFALDSTFILAALRLVNAHNWLLTGEAPDIDLKRLAAQHGADLFELDRLILDALLAGNDVTRFAIYDSAIKKYPRDAYLALQYADAMFHRGPYLGLPLDTAARLLEEAARKDSAFGPTFYHLNWVWTRLDDSAKAWRALNRFKAVSGPLEEVDYMPALFDFTSTERFVPAQIAPTRQAVAQEAAVGGELQRGLRLAPTFDLWNSQVQLGAMFASAPFIDRKRLASAVEAQAIGKIALGQMGDALTLLDSAAVLFDSPMAHLQAAEWRVIAPLVGLPEASQSETEQGRHALETLTTDPVVGRFAQFALAFDATKRGNLVTARRLRNALGSSKPDSFAAYLVRLLEAIEQGAIAQYDSALVLTALLLAHDSAGVGTGRDPFARAVLHLKRAEWLDRVGQPAAADSARAWYQHSDFGVRPQQEALPAEIDWALGVYAEWLRAKTAFSRGDRLATCRSVQRVLRLWANADSAYAHLVSEARQREMQTCR